MKPRRIAFLTPEYVTTHGDQGGLATYVHNMARSLAERGHEVTVFVGGSPVRATLRHEQIAVHQVLPADNALTRIMAALARCHWRISDLYRGTLKHLRVAAGLAQAMEAAHRACPFDLVQSSEFGLSGLFVARRQGRKHLVRCSSTGDLLVGISREHPGWDARLLMALERRCIARADAAYAPSRFAADHYKKRFGLQVEVLRPPLAFSARWVAKKPGQLPGKYLLFLGKLGRIKGTDILAQALTLAWRQEPELTMVWAGAQAQAGVWRQCCEIMGERARQVYWLGAVDRDRLPAIIAGAQAAVLPSRCDNLPNTMLESLSLGIPVIGSTAGGFDEIIQPGFNGKLVPPENATLLAQAMVNVWRGDLSHRRGKDLRTPAMREMEPPVAAGNLLRLAGLSEDCVQLQLISRRQAA